MLPQKPILATALSCLSLLPVHSYADELNSETTELAPIVIEAKARSDVQHLNEQDIQRLPTRNGNIVDLLRTNPAVQFSNSSNSSTQAGEISSDTVSFHGEPYYNNAFMLDGFSNNDSMNPGASNSGFTSEEEFESPTGMYLAPGSPEAFQVDTALVQQVDVYDSNVPAKYNRFTGGVVDAKLKDPDTQAASGSVSFRTTRDNWTQLHYTDEQVEKYGEIDATDDVQPEFVKQTYNLSLNQPLSDNAALLLSYNRTQSRIPENHTILGQRVEEKRLAQTLMLKGLYQANEDNRLTATLMYSPHENTYYANNVKNGRYQSEGGGWRANLNWQHDFDGGKVETALAYTQDKNKIGYDAGYDYYNWKASNSLDWCTLRSTSSGDCLWSREGGLGTLESTTKTWTLKQDWQWDALAAGDSAAHSFSAGWNIDLAQAHASRPQDVRYMSYTGTALPPTSNGCQDCIPGEQYQNSMVKYRAYDTSVQVNNYSFYAQDEMQLGRVTLTPGLNFNYDDFLGNFNISPRFAFNIDALGNERLHVFGGLNRYYAGNMLAYALRAKVPYNESYTRKNDPNNGESDWTFEKYAANSVAWDTSDLKTPYSDEANIGFDYTLGNHVLSAKFVHRDSHDQFKSSRRDDDVKIMSNEGATSANTFSLGLASKQAYEWGPLQLGYQFGARYQKTKTNNQGNYDESLLADVTTVTTPYYLFEGKRYESAEDLPPFNYNTPWNAFLEIQTDFPTWHLRWTHRLNYRDGYTHYNRSTVLSCAQSSQPEACGDWEGRVYDYTKRSYKDAFTLDWRFLVDIPVRGKQKFELSLDVLNVLDNKVAGSDASSTYLGGTSSQYSSTYEVGRQFWLGAAYRW
ncbi:TonB-dependent receptor plug domain-containing protein [Vitreoscilla massiliensis]|uniref:TonB-dependent receptor plug domain-containing protein n=1 Tax=Vitreoscilla massiliensis TaxID=1689272 RepID=A0ABY4E5C3_9NEIS|nr:TonB-dependent receptor plug domain-containing protein [Vitreoscilla massiliensis]UOO90968.1 TonB-dependent receptor plug domain-containing protein [Vitreoscilla massiliensis]